jgi:HEAT repeat protein
MGFDIENFGFGLLAGWASAYGVYRARHSIGSAISATRSQATSAQHYATRSADGRYINDLIQQCETSHLAGKSVNLTDILVEPRFLNAPPMAAPPDDDVTHSVFHIVPQVADHPFLHAVYNLESLSIDDLSGGSRALALLGNPGSGRSTALMTIALHALGKTRFLKAEDKLQQSLDAEEAALSEKERAARIKERIALEERARQRLKDEHNISFESLIGNEANANVPLFNRLMPVYVHLASISLNVAEFSADIDPAEPLIRAVQHQVGPITARAIPRNMYQRLDKGEVLLLVDGFDDLPPAEQAEKSLWLQALMQAYSGNFFIVAGPARGYGRLTQIGLTPVFIRPWDDTDLETAVERWRQAWPQLAGTRRKPAEAPAPEQLRRAQANNRALSPVDVTLKVWAAFANDTEKASFEGWAHAYIQRLLPPKMPLDNILPQLAALAVLQLEQGFITAENLAQANIQLSDEMSDMLAAESAAAEEEATTDTPEPAKSERDGKDKEETSNQNKLFAALRQTGLLVAYRNNRYQFRHAYITAYLASLTLKGLSAPQLEAKTQSPVWRLALTYAAAHSSVDALIRAHLSQPADVLNNQIFDIARWLAYASPQAEWRGPILKHLGNILLAPNQYPLTRERAAAALISTRDKKTVFIFRQAARSANPHIRLLACLGIGAIGDPDAINDLIPLTEDQEKDVQLAAGIALGAIGTQEALEAMVILLTEGSEHIRQAVAEALAAIPDEGHPVLYDGIVHDDMMVRRASAFGLRRIHATWSVVSLYRAFLEDTQWYVRSAAQQAFQELEQEGHNSPQAYVRPDELAWLAEWAAEQGEGIPPGAGTQILIKAMHEAEPDFRALSAQALGQLGEVTALKPLYDALRDRQQEVRSAAHRALGELELQLAEGLPSPN